MTDNVIPAFVKLPSDVANSGKPIDHNIVTREDASTAYRECISIGDSADGTRALAISETGGISTSISAIRSSQLTPFVINSDAGGPLPIVTALDGRSVRLYRIILFVGGSTTIKFQDGETDLSGPMPLNNTGSIALDFSGDPWYESSVGSTININSSNAVQLSGTAYYVQN